MASIELQSDASETYEYLEERRTIDLLLQHIGILEEGASWNENYVTWPWGTKNWQIAGLTDIAATKLAMLWW